MLIRQLAFMLGLIVSPALADLTRQIAAVGAWAVFETREEKSSLRSYVAKATAENSADMLQVSCHPPSPTLRGGDQLGHSAGKRLPQRGLSS